MSLRRFFRLLRNAHVHGSFPTVDDSLAKAAKDALSAGYTRGGVSSSTSKVYEHLAKGHKDYAKSFKKENG